MANNVFIQNKKFSYINNNMDLYNQTVFKHIFYSQNSQYLNKKREHDAKSFEISSVQTKNLKDLQLKSKYNSVSKTNKIDANVYNEKRISSMSHIQNLKRKYNKNLIIPVLPGKFSNFSSF